jgi:hypothetical protein
MECSFSCRTLFWLPPLYKLCTTCTWRKTTGSFFKTKERTREKEGNSKSLPFWFRVGLCFRFKRRRSSLPLGAKWWSDNPRDLLLNQSTATCNSWPRAHVHMWWMMDDEEYQIPVYGYFPLVTQWAIWKWIIRYIWWMEKSNEAWNRGRVPGYSVYLRAR